MRPAIWPAIARNSFGRLSQILAGREGCRSWATACLSSEVLFPTGEAAFG